MLNLWLRFELRNSGPSIESKSEIISFCSLPYPELLQLIILTASDSDSLADDESEPIEDTEDEDEDFKASEVAEKLKLQLKKLELIRILSDKMLQKKRNNCSETKFISF